MDSETIRSVVKGIFSTDLVKESLTFLWHAGEPMAVPVSWYRNAFEIIRSEAPPGLQICHSFQSNGTLIDENWCRFIKEEKIELGLSLDGPAHIHDAHRKTRGGEGTHGRAMRGVHLLREHGIDFFVIAVVTKDSLGHADEIYDFFIANGISHFGLNIEEEEDFNVTSSLKTSRKGEIEQFFRTMYERMKDSEGGVQIREFDIAMQRIFSHREASSVNFVYENEQTRPFGILSVDYKGNFATFSPEMLGVTTSQYGPFSFGSFHNGGIKNAVTNGSFLAVLNDIKAGVERCRRECAYFNLCGGGAPSNKYFENGSFDSTETSYCRYVIQLPLSIVLEDLEKNPLELSLPPDFRPQLS